MYLDDWAFVSIFRAYGAFGIVRGEEKPTPDFSSCSTSIWIDNEPSFAGKDDKLSTFITEITIGHECKNSPTV